MPACLMIPLVYPQPLVDKLGSGLQSEIFSHDFEGITSFFPTAVVEKSDSCFFIYDLLLLLLLLSRFSRVQLCVTPETAAHQALPSLGFSRQDSPGVGCHSLLQCMKVKSESEVAQLCPTLRHPMDCSLPGSSTHGSFQARVLEWVAIAFSVIETSEVHKQVRHI